MKDKIIFAFYLIATVVFVSMSNWVFFAFFASVFLLISPKIALKSIKTILFFNASVTIGYLIESLIIECSVGSFIIMFNLRVFCITFLTLYIVPKINMGHVLAFSKTLQFLFLASLSQINSFQKTYKDFILALKSRTVKKLGERKKKEFISAMLFFFLKKSLNNSKERTLALKARGFFD